MDVEQRMAIAETNIKHASDDVAVLFSEVKEMMAYVRKHMEKEEEDRRILLQQIEKDRLLLLEKIEEIKASQAKMKAFTAGVASAVSLLWTAAIALFYMFGKHS
jgi:hypothetical protein